MSKEIRERNFQLNCKILQAVFSPAEWRVLSRDEFFVQALALQDPVDLLSLGLRLLSRVAPTRSPVTDAIQRCLLA